MSGGLDQVETWTEAMLHNGLAFMLIPMLPLVLLSGEYVAWIALCQMGVWYGVTLIVLSVVITRAFRHDIPSYFTHIVLYLMYVGLFGISFYMFLASALSLRDACEANRIASAVAETAMAATVK